jgi:hypothetical protein
MFRIGQKVCIAPHPEWEANGVLNIPKVGEVYTVRGLGESEGILLEEIRNDPPPDYSIELLTGEIVPPTEDEFWQCRFRPLVERKTDISVFKKILDRVNTRKRRRVLVNSDDPRPHGSRTWKKNDPVGEIVATRAQMERFACDRNFNADIGDPRNHTYLTPLGNPEAEEYARVFADAVYGAIADDCGGFASEADSDECYAQCLINGRKHECEPEYAELICFRG